MSHLEVDSTRIEIAGVVIDYRYDALGRRMEKSRTGTTAGVWRFVLDWEDVLAVAAENNTLSAQITHGPLTDEPLLISSGALSLFPHADGLGNIAALSDESGLPVMRFEYTAYGMTTASGTLSADVYRYAYVAREYEPETGIYFLRARYYDPLIGRFLSEDPIEFSGGLNFYAYTKNNPINFSDPYGLLVTGTFDPDTGKVTVTDDDTGETASAIAFSGGTYQDEKGNLYVFDPIPDGEYTITREPRGKHPEWFGLFANDGEVDDRTRSDGKWRDGFRFHKGQVSAGCITVDLAQKNVDKKWKKIRDLIRKTKNQQSIRYGDNGKGGKMSIRTYGKMTVKPSKR